jgi:integrase
MRNFLYRRGRIWWMAYVVDGKQHRESTKTKNKHLARKVLHLRVGEIIEERKEPRQPHILTFEEEGELLKDAPDLIRVLVILILETGLRVGREALMLRWEDVDFANESVRIRQSKTVAGIRTVPMSSRCKAELLRWMRRLGPENSEYAFANPQRPDKHLVNVRSAWAKALRAAGIEDLRLFDLRYTFASRMVYAGVSPVVVGQIMGYSSPNILQTYALAIDEYRRSAISKLEALREAKSKKTRIRAQTVRAARRAL